MKDARRDGLIEAFLIAFTPPLPPVYRYIYTHPAPGSGHQQQSARSPRITTPDIGRSASLFRSVDDFLYFYPPEFCHLYVSGIKSRAEYVRPARDYIARVFMIGP